MVSIRWLRADKIAPVMKALRHYEVAGDIKQFELRERSALIAIDVHTVPLLRRADDLVRGAGILMEDYCRDEGEE